MPTGARRVLEAHPALPVVGVAKVEHRRVGAERLAAAPAWVAGLVGGEQLGSEAAMGGAIATLGGGATAGLPLGLAGGAAAGLLTARSGSHQGASGTGPAGERTGAKAGWAHDRTRPPASSTILSTPASS